VCRTPACRSRSDSGYLGTTIFVSGEMVDRRWRRPEFGPRRGQGSQREPSGTLRLGGLRGVGGRAEQAGWDERGLFRSTFRYVSASSARSWCWITISRPPRAWFLARPGLRAIADAYQTRRPRYPTGGRVPACSISRRAPPNREPRSTRREAAESSCISARARSHPLKRHGDQAKRRGFTERSHFVYICGEVAAIVRRNWSGHGRGCG
jgi:hypothetical protein